MNKPIDWLDKEQVLYHLGQLASYYHLTIVPLISSTNTVLLNDHQALHGTVLAAEWQNQGRGRRGKVWQASIGASLMFSLKWIFSQPIAHLSGLSLAVGVAIMRALHTLELKGAGLKWPNDLICDAGKLGGVLVEIAGNTSDSCEVIIGIGLNTSPLDTSLSVENYAHLQMLGCSGGRNLLFAVLLTHLHEVLRQFGQEGFSPFASEWEKAHLWQNKTVNVLEGAVLKMTGQVTGVAKNGALRLLLNGTEIELVSGDLSLRRQE